MSAMELCRRLLRCWRTCALQAVCLFTKAADRHAATSCHGLPRQSYAVVVGSSGTSDAGATKLSCALVPKLCVVHFQTGRPVFSDLCCKACNHVATMKLQQNSSHLWTSLD